MILVYLRIRISTHYIFYNIELNVPLKDRTMTVVDYTLAACGFTTY